jgi:hypothetical protein
VSSLSFDFSVVASFAVVEGGGCAFFPSSRSDLRGTDVLNEPTLSKVKDLLFLVRKSAPKRHWASCRAQEHEARE